MKKTKDKSMKKNLVIFWLSVLGLSVSAQSTFHVNRLPDNYFYNYWYEVDSNTQAVSSSANYVLSEKVYGKRFFAEGKDSLRIYGVAASLETFDLNSTIIEYNVYEPDGEVVHIVDSSSYYSTLAKMCDTSAYEEAYEYFGLYKHLGDSLCLISPQLTVNIKTTPVTYYLDLGTRESPYSSERTRPFPVYEMYFDSAVTVSDSFYVGMTSRIFYHENKCNGAMFYTWPIVWRNIIPDPGPTTCPDGVAWFQSSPNRGMSRWVYFPNSMYLYYVFPIIDTSHNSYLDTMNHSGGGNDSIDTVGVSTLSPERFVVLGPNPATREVRVVSKIGRAHV